MSMSRRAIPYASSVDEATQILRGNWLQAIEQHHQQYSKTSMINDILDVGCSVGESTKYLAAKFPNAKVTVSDPYVRKFCLNTRSLILLLTCFL